MDTLFLVGRIVLGVYFVMAGIMHFAKSKDMIGYATMKKLPMPKWSVFISGAVLVAGGLGVLVQYQLGWAYGLLIAFLLSAAFFMHNFWEAKDAQSAMMDMTQFQKNVALAAALAMLLATSV